MTCQLHLPRFRVHSPAALKHKLLFLPTREPGKGFCGVQEYLGLGVKIRCGHVIEAVHFQRFNHSLEWALCIQGWMLPCEILEIPLACWGICHLA